MTSDEAHVAGPQVSAGSIAGFHIDLSVHGDRELAHAGIVKLLAAARTPGARDDPGKKFMTMPWIVLRPFVAMLISSR